MKKIIILSTLFLFTFTCIAQSNELDSFSLPKDYLHGTYGVLGSDGEFANDLSFASLGYAHKLSNKPGHWGSFYISYKLNFLFFDLEEPFNNIGLSTTGDQDLKGFSYGVEVNILKFNQYTHNLTWLIGLGFGFSIPHIEGESGQINSTPYNLQFNSEHEFTANFKIGLKYQFSKSFALLPTFEIRKAFSHLQVLDDVSQKRYTYDNYLAAGLAFSILYTWN